MVPVWKGKCGDVRTECNCDQCHREKRRDDPDNKQDDIEMDTGEGYLQMVIKASGFQDYSNEFAVKIVK